MKKERLIHFSYKNLLAKTKITSSLRLCAPIRKLFEAGYLQGFFRKDGLNYKPTFVGRLVNLDHASILSSYNSIIRSVFNYYSFVDNKKSLRI